jgi:hypothetical protein
MQGSGGHYQAQRCAVQGNTESLQRMTFSCTPSSTRWTAGAITDVVHGEQNRPLWEQCSDRDIALAEQGAQLGARTAVRKGKLVAVNRDRRN